MMMIVKISRPLHRIVSVDNFCNYSAMLGLRVFEIVDLGHDYDLIKFSCAEDCNYVLTGGPCMISVIISLWKNGFQISILKSISINLRVNDQIHPQKFSLIYNYYLIFF